MFFPDHTFHSARFIDNDRQTIEVLLKVEGQDGFTPVNVPVDPKDASFKELTKDIKLEDIHTNTDTQLLLERKELAKLFFRLGQKEGYIPEDLNTKQKREVTREYANMVELIGEDARVTGGAATEEIEAPVAVVQSIEEKIQDVIDYILAPETAEFEKENLFKLKLHVFENDAVKNCKDRKLKAAVRKGNTPKDVLLASTKILKG